MAENKELKASTEAKRQKKADRRDAKAARKEANKVEEKKSRPNNIILAIMIFGVLIIMFAFVSGYNYFSKPANVEKYVKDNGIDEMYKKTPISEHTTMTLKAEKNTLKIWLNIDESITEPASSSARRPSSAITSSCIRAKKVPTLSKTWDLTS